jgi:hypothetical protein
VISWENIADFTCAFDRKEPVLGQKQRASKPVSGHRDNCLPMAFNKAVLVLSIRW